jgi:hypothetical protein
VVLLTDELEALVNAADATTSRTTGPAAAAVTDWPSREAACAALDRMTADRDAWRQRAEKAEKAAAELEADSEYKLKHLGRELIEANARADQLNIRCGWYRVRAGVVLAALTSTGNSPAMLIAEASDILKEVIDRDKIDAAGGQRPAVDERERTPARFIVRVVARESSRTVLAVRCARTGQMPEPATRMMPGDSMTRGGVVFDYREDTTAGMDLDPDAYRKASTELDRVARLNGGTYLNIPESFRPNTDHAGPGAVAEAERLALAVARIVAEYWRLARKVNETDKVAHQRADAMSVAHALAAYGRAAVGRGDAKNWQEAVSRLEALVEQITKPVGGKATVIDKIKSATVIVEPNRGGSVRVQVEANDRDPEIAIEIPPGEVRAALTGDFVVRVRNVAPAEKDCVTVDGAADESTPTTRTHTAAEYDELAKRLAVLEEFVVAKMPTPDPERARVEKTLEAYSALGDRASRELKREHIKSTARTVGSFTVAMGSCLSVWQRYSLTGRPLAAQANARVAEWCAETVSSYLGEDHDPETYRLPDVCPR